MTKIIATEDELNNMIQARISNSDELDGDCREVIVSPVYWHKEDETGSNWDVHSLRNARGCTDVVNAIVSEFRKKYSLKEKRNKR